MNLETMTSNSMAMSDSLFDQRSSLSSQFPTDGTHSQQLRGLVPYAVQAPSSYNSQPWRFSLTSEALQIRADRSRALPVTDPDHRELTIGCGAAVEFAVIALRHFGWEAAVHLFPDPADPDLLASLGVGIPLPPTEDDEALFAAIPKRHTSRWAFEARLLPPKLRSSLKSAAAHHSAWLKWISAPLQGSLFDLVMEGDRMQMADPAFRRELSVWLRPNSWHTPDGLQGYKSDLISIDPNASPLAARTFDLGNGRGARDAELADGSPEIAILGTDRDTPRDWMRTGQAIARILLGATASGVQASFLNQPVQLPSLRTRLKQLVATPGIPQLVVRMGFGHPGQPTPRRATEDVLL